MVAVDRSTNSAPRCPSATLSKIERIARAPAFAEGHHDAGDDERREELQQPAADAGDETERRLGQVADLRLHALHQCGQIGVRLRPECVHLLADQRPLGDAFSWRRHLERVVLHVVDQSVHRVAERVHQRRGRHDDHDDSEQHEQRRGQSLAAADLRGHRLMQGIESDGQNQSPGHQAQERREHLKAEHGQGQDEAGANEDVEKEGGGSAFELGIGIVQCAHRVIRPVSPACLIPGEIDAATRATRWPPGPEEGLTRIAWRVKQLRLSGGRSGLWPDHDISWPARLSPQTFRSLARLRPPSGAERLEQPEVLGFQRAVAVGQVEAGQHAGRQGGQRPVVVG